MQLVEETPHYFLLKFENKNYKYDQITNVYNERCEYIKDHSYLYHLLIHLHPLLTQQNINFSKTDQDIDLQFGTVYPTVVHYTCTLKLLSREGKCPLCTCTYGSL